MLSEKNTLISVIVPVYKVEPYLRCCVDSILTQTFTDFELILVDDGSPDNCGSICDEYAAEDDRVVVIHQENQGVSVARNTGLDWVFANSDSQWIAFVDSDDYIPVEYLEQLHKYAVLENADIVHTWEKNVFDDNEKILFYEKINYQTYTGRAACKTLFEKDAVISIMVWGKLFRKELFFSLRFPEGKVHEDENLMPKIIYLAPKVVVLYAGWYCYRHRPGSIMDVGFSNKRFDAIDAQSSLISFFLDNNDIELANLARLKKKRIWTNYVAKAWLAKQQASIPEKYKLPVWKAFGFLIIDSVRNGGMKYVLLRIRNMFSWNPNDDFKRNSPK